MMKNKLWGSRFKKGTDPLADKFSFSIDYDYRLAPYDIAVGIVHAEMLGKTRIISKKDAQRIISGLKRLKTQWEHREFRVDSSAEDIHTLIQGKLKKLIGEAADKLHTARSRNDLIATDMRLYLKHELALIHQLIQGLQKSIVRLADKNKNLIIPAYTHLQPAQVVLLSHYLLAYVEMFDRDKDRLRDTLKRLDSLPLGSCALSGTTLPIDREFVRKKLGFSIMSANSIDAVSDRDFVIEALSALAILGMHCSRMAEDFIIWSTNEFGFVKIEWSFSTGSSIMPHKKNPDILELIRGETAQLYGNLLSVLVLMKGLPLTYNRDMQLDKPPVFNSIDKLKDILQLLVKIFTTIVFDKTKLPWDTGDEYYYSVDIMEYLIKKGLTYRKAHDIVGKIFQETLDKGKNISNLSEKELKNYCPLFDADVIRLLFPKSSLRLKRSFGSTNPLLVDKQLKIWKKKLHA